MDLPDSQLKIIPKEIAEQHIVLDLTREARTVASAKVHLGDAASLDYGDLRVRVKLDSVVPSIRGFRAELVLQLQTCS